MTKGGVGRKPLTKKGKKGIFPNSKKPGRTKNWTKGNEQKTRGGKMKSLPYPSGEKKKESQVSKYSRKRSQKQTIREKKEGSYKVGGKGIIKGKGGKSKDSP